MRSLSMRVCEELEMSCEGWRLGGRDMVLTGGGSEIWRRLAIVEAVPIVPGPVAEGEDGTSEMF